MKASKLAAKSVRTRAKPLPAGVKSPAAPGLRQGRLADNPYAIGDEGPIDLFELGDEQTVKGIFETDVTLVPPLSHVHALPTETPIWCVVRSRSWSAR